MKTVEPNRCWSCLDTLTAETSVDISAELRIPCCRECWAEIPVAMRMTIVREMAYLPGKLAAELATKAGWDQVREFFRAAQAGDLQRLSPFDIGENWRN